MTFHLHTHTHTHLSYQANAVFDEAKSIILKAQVTSHSNGRSHFAKRNAWSLHKNRFTIWLQLLSKPAWTAISTEGWVCSSDPTEDVHIGRPFVKIWHKSSLPKTTTNTPHSADMSPSAVPPGLVVHQSLDHYQIQHLSLYTLQRGAF